MNHIGLVSKAKSAIDAVFTDRSVTATVTLESLRELSEEIDTLIDALNSDVKGGSREE